jgi:hypothetical protein
MTTGAKGVERAHQALEVAGDDPDVFVNDVFALSFLGEDIRTQLALIEKALVLNPSFARGWGSAGRCGHGPDSTISRSNT